MNNQIIKIHVFVSKLSHDIIVLNSYNPGHVLYTQIYLGILFSFFPFFFFCRPGGILVCKLEGASFWEKTPGADFVPHCLTLPEGT